MPRLLSGFVLACAGLAPGLAGAQSPVPASGSESGASADVQWDDLLLPRGFFLDLASGRVADQPFEGEALRYEAGGLVAEEGGVGSFPEPSGPEGRIVRGELIHGSSWKATRGQILGFELGVRGWGFLRVLEVTPGFVRLERWAQDGGAPGTAHWRAQRLEVRLDVGVAPVLTPLADTTGGPWRVEARELGSGRDWEQLGEWTGIDDFPDPGAGSDALREYRLVPLRADGLFGLRARGVAGRSPDGTTGPLSRDDRVNLLTSTVGAGRCDLTISGVSSGGINIAPQPGVRIATLGTNELEGWLLPDANSTRYANQQRYLGLDRELAVILPEGIFVHLRAVPGSDSGARLVADVNLWGERLMLPRPGPVAWSWSESDGVRLEAVREPPAAVSERVRGRLLERELGFGSGDWQTVDIREPGLEQYDPNGGPIGVVRYRCTWVCWNGERGPSGDPFGVLVGDDGGASSEALIDGLIATLGHEDYDERRKARAGLRALGDRALPQIRAALSSPDAEVAGAARELFGELTALPEEDPLAVPSKGQPQPKGTPPKGRDDELPPPVAGDAELLTSLGASRGLPPAPDGWLAAEANERASAMLASLDAAEPVPEGWRALLAEADPDPAVRLVASLYPELARPPEWAPSFGLIDGDVSSDSPLVEAALRGLDARDPWPTLVRLQLLHRLDLARAGTAEEAAALEGARLSMQLLERFAEGGEEVFLDAALQIASDPRARLRATRNLFELRGADLARPEGRTELVLDRADGTLLRDTLESLRNSDNTRIDLILPEGDYELASGDLRTARLYGDGLRVIGRGQVRLAFGLNLLGEGDVSFENIEIDPRGSACLHLQGANATLVGCRLRSAGQGIQVRGGLLELIDCELVTQSDRGGKGGNGIRLTDRSAVRLLRTRLDPGGDALVGARLALIERSVLDGGERNAVSGMNQGELLAVDSMIRAGSNALHSVGQGLLEGCVLHGGAAVASQLGERVHACPSHLLAVGPEGARNDWERLPACPVGR